MRFDNLTDWLDWQATLHVKEIDLGLERVRSVWQQLHPKAFQPFVITIAGTNGKGSCTAYLESILLEAGYSVGSYTSPHLVRYNERIKLQGREVDDELICQAFEAIDQARGDTSLSYFEFGTLAALQVFSQKTPDVVILEVGLGGRLDAVNIIDADVALVTTIDLDHQDWLGDTREKIGFEKAGIFRSGHPAVFASTDMPESVAQHARNIGANLQQAGVDFSYQAKADSWDFRYLDQWTYALPFPVLRGSHQLQNAAAVLAVLKNCRQQLPVETQAIRNGLLNVSLSGRFQVFPGDITVIVDVAHNQQAMQTLRSNLQQMVTKGKTHLIIGMLKDKDAAKALRELVPVTDDWNFIGTEGVRGMTATELAQQVKNIEGIKNPQLFENLGKAYASVLQLAEDGDTIVVAGSFLHAGEMLQLLEEGSGEHINNG